MKHIEKINKLWYLVEKTRYIEKRLLIKRFLIIDLQKKYIYISLENGGFRKIKTIFYCYNGTFYKFKKEIRNQFIFNL